MKLSEHARSTHNQDGAVVLDIRHGQMFRLNLVGSRTLELLQSGLTESQIANVVSREFSAERNAVARDIEKFLVHLRRHHLIEFREAEPHAAA
jgi:hypothetical protein